MKKQELLNIIDNAEKDAIKTLKNKTIPYLDDDELMQLREDIELGSLYANSYQNRFEIDENSTRDFFSGYVDFLWDIAEKNNEDADKFNLDYLIDNYDNINNLCEYRLLYERYIQKDIDQQQGANINYIQLSFDYIRGYIDDIYEKLKQINEGCL